MRPVMKLRDESILAICIATAFAVAGLCFWFAVCELTRSWWTGPWTN